MSGWRSGALAAALFGAAAVLRADAPAPSASPPDAATPLSTSGVLTGLDVLERSQFDVLQGRRVALITNQTGRDRAGRSTVEVLSHAPGVTLVSILSPEHGYTGQARDGQQVADSSDAASGLPVYSLYGKSERITPTMLVGVDTIVFDIQDIGTRFYTFITTMGMALEEAAADHLRFVVLDRPNPIRGDILEGDLLDPDIHRMTGYFEIPVRHGFTVGELADWMNETKSLGADLHVVKMEGWRRSMWFDQTGLAFTPPSPNIRSLTAALLYPGIGCFEATNVSVGRGTPKPFEQFGAPWIDGNDLARWLNARALPGLSFAPVTYVPTDDLYQGQTCRGVSITVTDRNQARPFDAFVAAFLYLSRQNPTAFVPNWEEVRVVTGSGSLRDVAAGRATAQGYLVWIRRRLESFRREAQRFYLY